MASHDDLRLSAFAAGLIGPAWLLLDDLLTMDHTQLRLGAALSDDFVLGCGTALGRKVSVHFFNCFMRVLYDKIASYSSGVVIPGGALPPFIVICLQYIDDLLSPAEDPEQLQEFFRRCEAFTHDHGPPFNIAPRNPPL